MIDKLKEDVIKAARKCHGYPNDSEITKALDALDAALAPDPWRLLERSRTYIASSYSHHELAAEIEAALAWKQDQS